MSIEIQNPTFKKKSRKLKNNLKLIGRMSILSTFMSLQCHQNDRKSNSTNISSIQVVRISVYRRVSNMKHTTNIKNVCATDIVIMMNLLSFVISGECVDDTTTKIIIQYNDMHGG